MTERERYVAALTFGRPDKVPFDPGYGRKSTREAWQKQGLPAEVRDIGAHVRELLGIAPLESDDTPWPHPDFRMVPQFEEKVLERRPAPDAGMRGTLVVQDWKGNICEISDEFDVSYLRNAIDFVTRSWIKCPVENRGDWEAMKRRYDTEDPARFPSDFALKMKAAAKRTRPRGISFSGPFWQMREWLGFENLCMAFHDDPAMVRDMVQFWEAFVARMLEKTFAHGTPDFVMVNEDMAYKEKPMIGPAMAREFLGHCWKTWAEQCRRAGVPVYEVDSDGHVGELLPVFIECGFTCNSPMEVAAGNDLAHYRRTYGTRMSYRGGVDKRAMARGGRTLREEMERMAAVVAMGGVIPSCDHGIPADVSWENFLDYCRQLAAITGWR